MNEHTERLRAELEDLRRAVNAKESEFAIALLNDCPIKHGDLIEIDGKVYRAIPRFECGQVHIHGRKQLKNGSFGNSTQWLTLIVENVKKVQP